MEIPTHALLMYGYLLLFAWVLMEQLGLPLPATPVLLAAGALSADGPISFPLAFAASLAAALILASLVNHYLRSRPGPDLPAAMDEHPVNSWNP